MAEHDEFPWEIGYVVDEHLRCTGFGVVRGRIQNSLHVEQLEELATDHHIIGMTCQGVFPMIGNIPGNLPDGEGLIDGRNEPYMEFIEGWAHCFRNPDDYLPEGPPRTRFSNSDNINADRIWNIATEFGRMDKKWDFFYTCMPERSNIVRKNWELAKKCAVRFADELGLRGVLVGVADLDDAPDHPNIDTLPKLKWREFIRTLGQSRAAFFPNTWDPSPRVMAEALCLDIPIVTNESILGGWQYIAAESGRSFIDEDGAVEAMDRTRSDETSPREWYTTHFGHHNAGPRLAEFLREISNGEGGTSALPTASFYSPRDYSGAPPR